MHVSVLCFMGFTVGMLVNIHQRKIKLTHCSYLVRLCMLSPYKRETEGMLDVIMAREAMNSKANLKKACEITRKSYKFPKRKKIRWTYLCDAIFLLVVGGVMADSKSEAYKVCKEYLEQLNIPPHLLDNTMLDILNEFKRIMSQVTDEIEYVNVYPRLLQSLPYIIYRNFETIF